MSIIFGLSAAVSSLLIAGQLQPKQISNDPHVAQRLSERSNKDDLTTLSRLKYLQSLTLLSVLVGLFYQVTLQDGRAELLCSISAAAFAWSAVFCLLYSLALPALFGRMQARNSVLKRYE